jgi:hypothetical protein
MNVDFELILESNKPKEEIYELQEWIEESNFKTLGIKVKEIQEDNQTGQMGLETLAVLELIVTLAGSAGVVAFINGLFSCIKSYILTKSKERQVVLKKGDGEIIFNSESVKDLQPLIEKFIATLDTSADLKSLESSQKVDPKRLSSSDS